MGLAAGLRQQLSQSLWAEGFEVQGDTFALAVEFDLTAQGLGHLLQALCGLLGADAGLLTQLLGLLLQGLHLRGLLRQASTLRVTRAQHLQCRRHRPLPHYQHQHQTQRPLDADLFARAALRQPSVPGVHGLASVRNTAWLPSMRNW